MNFPAKAIIRDAALMFFSLILVFLLALAPNAAKAQEAPSQIDIDEFRKLLAELLRQDDFANFLAGVLNVTISPDVAAANYDVTNNSDSAREMSTFKIPLGTSFALSRPGWELVLSGNLGYLQAKDEAFAVLTDYDLDTKFDIKWTAYTAQGGLGLKVPVTKAVYLYPHAAVAYSYLKNRADYPSSRAKQLLDPLFNGIITDFDVQSMTYSAALGLGYEETLGVVDVSLRGMFTYAYTDSFKQTHDVQSISEDTETLVVRLETRAPTGLSIAGHGVRWLGLAGYTTFFGPNRDALGFSYIAEVGLGFDIDISTENNFLDHIGLRGSYLFGDDMTGWQVGLAYDF